MKHSTYRMGNARGVARLQHMVTGHGLRICGRQPACRRAFGNCRSRQDMLQNAAHAHDGEGGLCPNRLSGLNC